MNVGGGRMRERKKHGCVAGLPDEELADPEELERQVFLEDWGAVLELPIRSGNPIKPNIDEYFGVDWGAFGTVDFERTIPRIDKVGYKVEKLSEERRNVVMKLEIVGRRVPERTREEVLESVRKGILDTGDIPDFDTYYVAELDLRARRLQREIVRLVKLRARRKR
jgi:hypothetical protein